MKLPKPFAYPTEPHVRRHGPVGYSQYRHYRNWLRDEFAFRCIYCLRRETWLTLSRDHSIDHFLPKSEHPEVEKAYNNLVYACSECNGTKAAKYLPSPEVVAYGKCLIVNAKGEISALNEAGRNIIEALHLDSVRYTEMRRKILDTISEVKVGGKAMKWLLGFPDDLPNLSQERAPKSNLRLAGIQQSYWERKQRDDLPEYY